MTKIRHVRDGDGAGMTVKRQLDPGPCEFRPEFDWHGVCFFKGRMGQ